MFTKAPTDTLKDEVLFKNPPLARMQDVGPGSYQHDDKKMPPHSFNIKTSEVFQVIMNDSIRINRKFNSSATRDRSSSKNGFKYMEDSPNEKSNTIFRVIGSP